MALIPRDLAVDAAAQLLANEYPHIAAKREIPAFTCDSEPILQTPKPDVTAMPADVPAPFTVGGVYVFEDVYGRERTALVYTEQWARVGSAWWHVSQVPDEARLVDTFTPDSDMIADARRVAREIINSQEWS